jgi:hypothetical protein
VLLLAAMAAGSGVASAGPPPLPDDFLEYLGSWETDDGDWLIANAATVATTPTASRMGEAASDAAPLDHRSTITPRGTPTAASAPDTERK